MQMVYRYTIITLVCIALVRRTIRFFQAGTVVQALVLPSCSNLPEEGKFKFYNICYTK